VMNCGVCSHRKLTTSSSRGHRVLHACLARWATNRRGLDHPPFQPRRDLLFWQKETTCASCTGYARGLLSAMRPERGGMAINFAVSNFQVIRVNTDGHPSSSPTRARLDLRGKDRRLAGTDGTTRLTTCAHPEALLHFVDSARSARNTVETGTAPNARLAFTDCFLSVVAIAAYGVRGATTVPSPRRFATHPRPEVRAPRGARHGRTRRHPPTAGGFAGPRQLPRHDNTAVTSTTATTAASRRTGPDDPPAHRQPRSQPRRGKRFRIGASEQPHQTDA
jgi:hypothetical protein